MQIGGGGFIREKPLGPTRFGPVLRRCRRQYHLTIPMLLGLCWVALAGCAETSRAPLAIAGAAGQTGDGAGLVFARVDIAAVWRGPGILADDLCQRRAGRGDSSGDRVLSRLPPGTYSFTVQPFGLPTGQTATLQLAPGTVSYLNVDWVASWTQGYPPAGFDFVPNMFAILAISPQVARAYLPNSRLSRRTLASP